MIALDRSEYGEIYRRTFGKDFKRQACRYGWERWQKVWANNMAGMVLHPHGTTPPPEQASDYYIILTCFPLRFWWRAPETQFLLLPDQWSKSGLSEMAKQLDPNPRAAAARLFTMLLSTV